MPQMSSYGRGATPSYFSNNDDYDMEDDEYGYDQYYVEDDSNEGQCRLIV